MVFYDSHAGSRLHDGMCLVHKLQRMTSLLQKRATSGGELLAVLVKPTLGERGTLSLAATHQPRDLAASRLQRIRDRAAVTLVWPTRDARPSAETTAACSSRRRPSHRAGWMGGKSKTQVSMDELMTAR
jgi:hypothetical protein